MTARLTLVQWLSPAFPTGAFAYSHGLETAIAEGAVRDAVTLEAWLDGVIRAGGGWQDAVLIGLALRPGADLDALASTARALAPSAERLHETEEQGAAFARMVAGVTARSLPAEPLPIAIARAVLPLGLPAEDVIALAVQAFATNLVQIGIRAIPLGQTEGQAILSRLLPAIGAVAARAAQAEDDDLGAASLAADLHSIRHETQEVRLWKT